MDTNNCLKSRGASERASGRRNQWKPAMRLCKGKKDVIFRRNKKTKKKKQISTLRLARVFFCSQHKKSRQQNELICEKNWNFPAISEWQHSVRIYVKYECVCIYKDVSVHGQPRKDVGWLIAISPLVECARARESVESASFPFSICDLYLCVVLFSLFFAYFTLYLLYCCRTAAVV